MADTCTLARLCKLVWLIGPTRDVSHGETIQSELAKAAYVINSALTADHGKIMEAMSADLQEITSTQLVPQHVLASYAAVKRDRSSARAPCKDARGSLAPRDAAHPDGFYTMDECKAMDGAMWHGSTKIAGGRRIQRGGTVSPDDSMIVKTIAAGVVLAAGAGLVVGVWPIIEGYLIVGGIMPQLCGSGISRVGSYFAAMFHAGTSCMQRRKQYELIVNIATGMGLGTTAIGLGVGGWKWIREVIANTLNGAGARFEALSGSFSTATPAQKENEVDKVTKEVMAHAAKAGLTVGQAAAAAQQAPKTTETMETAATQVVAEAKSKGQPASIDVGNAHGIEAGSTLAAMQGAHLTATAAASTAYAGPGGPTGFGGGRRRATRGGKRRGRKTRGGKRRGGKGRVARGMSCLTGACPPGSVGGRGRRNTRGGKRISRRNTRGGKRVSRRNTRGGKRVSRKSRR